MEVNLNRKVKSLITDLSSERLDAGNIECLPSNIPGTHVNDTLESEFTAHSRRRNTMMTGASFSDDSSPT